ncbi:MAG: hypothetical protein AB8H80_02735 [Planctomycetota bacterium]
MNFRLGMVWCLLAGCATQPTRFTAPAAERLLDGAGRAESETQSAAASRSVLAAAEASCPRVGLEFLPPDDRFPLLEPVRVEPRRSDRRPPTASERALHQVKLTRDDPTRAPRLNQIDFESIEDPIARETLHFCSDLIAADRRRVRREVGIPFFDFRNGRGGLGPELTSERRLREEHEEWSQEHGVRLLRQPLRLLGKRLPIAREFELAIQEFRTDHVPLSEPYRRAHGDRKRLGRMSMRVHVRDMTDPLEMVYIHPSGVRIGSSRRRAKMALDFPLGDALNLSLRARSEYETGNSGVRADLIYRPTSHVSVHFAAGDDMDFLSTSSLYSLFESPMDGSPGLLIYAIHTF